MTLLSGKNTLVLCLSSILCGCTTNGLPAPYSINLSFPVITQNQINSGGYYINDANKFGQLMVCALIQAQINRIVWRCGSVSMCNLSFSHFTEIESRRVRNVWMLQDRVRKKAHQSFFIHARVMITSAGSLMITKLRETEPKMPGHK